MTENEAQKWLERFEWDDSEETSDALATICEALQEYPKFKAIGTIEEFKALKEKEERFDRNIRMFNEIGLEIRAEAIDEFAERLKEKYGCLGYIDEIKFEEVDEIAEKMKAGGMNG